VLAAIQRIEAALRIQTAIPAPSHHLPSHASEQSHPGQSQSPPAWSAHQLYELRDAIRLMKESLPAVGPKGRIAFKRIRSTAEHVQEAAWSMRERAEKETGSEKEALNRRCGELEAQARKLSASCARLEELTASATMVAASLAKIETRLGDMIGAQQAQADIPAEPVAAEIPAAKRGPSETAWQPPAQTAADVPPAGISLTKPEPAQDIIAEAAAPQPRSSQTIIRPQAPAAAPANANWLDTLAPPVRARNTPDPSPAAALNFNFDDAPQPAIALSNPAVRETNPSVSEPVLPQAVIPQAAPIIEPKNAEAKTAEAPIVTPVLETAAETTSAPEPVREPEPVSEIATPSPIDDEPSENPAAFLFDPMPVAPQPRSAQAVVANGAGRTARPAFRPIQIVKPGDPLAPIIALSDEEKIALFS